MSDSVLCTKCKSHKLTRADFYPNDVSRAPYSWCKKCTVATAKLWRHSNHARAALSGKRGNLKANYGITVEQYDVVFAEQRGLCAICRGKGTRALAVDHNHKTDKIRGLLCDSCNNGLGRFKDSAKLLRKASEYLDKNDGHKGGV